jgi:endonuclease YncB( thermonuclease family)
MREPQFGIVAHAAVDRVVDGDTVDVLFGRIKVRIRLLKCWAPEIHGPQKDRGLKAKAFLEKLLPKGTPVKVQIPTTGATQLGDVLTLDRVLGHIWLNKKTVSEQMVAAGHARAEK